MKKFAMLMLMFGLIGVQAEAKVGPIAKPDCTKVIQKIKEQLDKRRASAEPAPDAVRTDPNSRTAQ